MILRKTIADSPDGAARLSRRWFKYETIVSFPRFIRRNAFIGKRLFLYLRVDFS
jgi:hypothetical protein